MNFHQNTRHFFPVISHQLISQKFSITLCRVPQDFIQYLSNGKVSSGLEIGHSNYYHYLAFLCFVFNAYLYDSLRFHIQCLFFSFRRYMTCFCNSKLFSGNCFPLLMSIFIPMQTVQGSIGCTDSVVSSKTIVSLKILMKPETILAASY